MDLYNMDEFLNLQDQNTTNLLATEQIEQPEQVEQEWHSATPLDEMLSTSNNDKEANWAILQNQLDSLQGINLTEIIGNNTFQNDNNCITPDFLIKQQPQEEKRVTRSRTAATTTAVKEEPKKKRNTRAKKVYCICQQPYNGKPMVQCDRCEEWFHCACVGFNPDTEDEEDIDWICDSCRQVNETKQEAMTEEQPKEEQETPQETSVQEQMSTRQTRGSTRSQSTCLYEGCTNHTKADSFCSDVCARKHNERRPSLRRKSTDQVSETSSTPSSPGQMTEEENPVRRNVIKNMTTILKPLFDTALEKTPDMFEESTTTSQERAEELAKSIETTMLQELGDLKGRHRTCGESYKSKFRSLLYNLKDKANNVFQLRVVTGDLTPMDLVTMSSEDMANPELKSMAEVLRKKSLKESVLKVENVPIFKKTHKGDIIMIPNKENENLYSPNVQQQLDKVDQQHKEPEPEEEEKEISGLSPTQPESKDPLDDILARITHQDSNTMKRSNSEDEEEDPEAKKRKLALEVEKLLGDDDDTPFQVDEVDTTDLKYSDDEDEHVKEKQEEEQEEQEEDEAMNSIWEGRVNMPQVAEFQASARQIGGRILSPTEWEDVLSPTMWIEGRIPTDRVNNYVTQTQYSTSREIVLLEIEAKGGDTDESSQVLLEYFETRQRYAVVGHNKTRVKDFYLVPLYKSQHIPDCLYVVRVEETKRKSDLFLGVLVLSKQAPQPKKEIPAYQPQQQPTYQPPQPSYQPSQQSSYQPPQQPTYQPSQPQQYQPAQPVYQQQPHSSYSQQPPQSYQQYDQGGYNNNSGYRYNQQRNNRNNYYNPY